MKVHVFCTDPRGGLQSEIRSLEEAGADGVFVGDHLFVSFGKSRRDALGGGDPFVRLAVAGMVSEHLTLGVSVVNVGFAHPVLAVRSFMELATEFGGERVLAGLGAGWNIEEFDAMGMEFPPFGRRMDRLEESAKLARTLFDEGFADLTGEHVTARELTLGPAPSPPPRLFLGGGSDRLLDIAGRYADVVDLNGSSRRLKLGGSQPIRRDMVRRLTTSVADLEDSALRVRQSATAAGRDPSAIEMSILVSDVRFCPTSEIETLERELCKQVGIDHQPLGDCPYVFLGPPERVRDQVAERAQRIGLRHLILFPIEYDVLARFTQEVATAMTGQT